MKPLAWVVAATIPSGWVADVARLQDQFETRHPDFASEGLEVEASGTTAHVTLEIAKREHARAFGRALGEILGARLEDEP